MRIFATIFAALLGLAFGSFLNVCLSRWPYGESIVRPGSHCRSCGHSLVWWENIPLLSWIFLHGRCRKCRASISWRYPLVEFLVAALWAYEGWHFIGDNGNSIFESDLFVYFLFNAVSMMIFMWLLVALSFLDAENFWLPDKLTLTGIALGLLITYTKPVLLMWLEQRIILHFNEGSGNLFYGLWKFVGGPLLGVLIAAAIILLIRWLYWLVRRKEGMGLGDAKLMAMLAAWLGLPGALLSLFIGVTLGATYSVLLLIRGYKYSNQATPEADSSETHEVSLKDKWAMTHLPLGTFLCIGGVVSSFYGERIIAAYLRWAGF